MPDPWERVRGGFEALADEHYPGSRHRRRPAPEAPREAQKAQSWDRTPKTFRYKGEDREFFMIGALAEALGKSEKTIRKWISQGVIPDAPLRTPKIPNTLGSGRTQDGAGRRLWTRPQIEAIVAIAQEEGILPGRSTKDHSETDFSARVWAWFKEHKT